jgi:hypothetical protein
VAETDTTRSEIVARDVPDGDLRLQISDFRFGIEELRDLGI